jgi:hypothetical protein
VGREEGEESEKTAHSLFFVGNGERLARQSRENHRKIRKKSRKNGVKKGREKERGEAS